MDLGTPELGVTAVFKRPGDIGEDREYDFAEAGRRFPLADGLLRSPRRLPPADS